MWWVWNVLPWRRLRRDHPAKILINLCVAIGLVNVIFLVGVQNYTSQSTVGCKVSLVNVIFLVGVQNYTSQSTVGCKVSLVNVIFLVGVQNYTSQSTVGCKVRYQHLNIWSVCRTTLHKVPWVVRWDINM